MTLTKASLLVLAACGCLAAQTPAPTWGLGITFQVRNASRRPYMVTPCLLSVLDGAKVLSAAKRVDPGSTATIDAKVSLKRLTRSGDFKIGILVQDQHQRSIQIYKASVMDPRRPEYLEVLVPWDEKTRMPNTAIVNRALQFPRNPSDPITIKTNSEAKSNKSITLLNGGEGPGVLIPINPATGDFDVDDVKAFLAYDPADGSFELH